MKQIALLAWIAPLFLAAPGLAQNSKPYPFQNPDLPAEQRIDDLLSVMTLDEKIACFGVSASVPRLGVIGTRHVEGLHGLAQGGPGGWGRPTIVPTTSFPQAIGMGETWDPDVVRQAAAAEGYEARYILQSPKYHQGGIVIRAPNADLGRDPRWGRTEECFGEDPYLVSSFVVAVVHGLQGDDPKYWQTASLLKHFFANSNEDGRFWTSSNFNERLFREYYGATFRAGIVEGGARAFMASYNQYNGVPCMAHPILRNIAVTEWGQDGIICTDGGAMANLTQYQHYYKTPEEAAAGCVKAGISQFLDRVFAPIVKRAVQQKLLRESDIDRSLRGNFRVSIHLGLLDPPSRVAYSQIGLPAHDPIEPWLREDQHQLVRQVTRESIVLLKNDGGLLPLDLHKLHSIAVIGPRSFEVLQDWYGGTPPYTVTPIEAIRHRTQTIRGFNVNYAPSDDDGGVLMHARDSDVAIVLVGNHPTGAAGWGKITFDSYGKEGIDRKSITLEQEELVKRVRAVNPHTIVVLVSSFPYAINWTEANVPAILHITHASDELGNALADVLFGDYNPAGRLVQTWPASLEQLPPMMDYDIRHGRTYMYSKFIPLYPFGYGLSYTTFAYSNLQTSADALSSDGTLNASVDVTNTGSRSGDEVVQLYVRHLNSAVDRPIKELKAFRRVSIAAGKTQTVTLELPASRLAYWDIGQHCFVVEKDKVELLVGASSADIRLRKTIDVD